MSTTSPASPQTPPARRSPVERMIVWGGILLLLAFVGYEFWVQKSYKDSIETLSSTLEASDKGGKKDIGLTNFDIKRLFGREPEFRGHPGQILTNSQYYEAYVWRSLLKRKFVAPPEKPQTVDLFAIYSGEVRPDLIKYREPEKKGEPSFFDAYVLYVYYGLEDPKTKAREVVSFAQEREKYLDETRKIPSKDELAEMHKKNLARAIAERESKGPRLTDKQKEEMDSWKYPRQANQNNNLMQIPGFLPGGKPVSPEENYTPVPLGTAPVEEDDRRKSDSPKSDAKETPKSAPKTESKEAPKAESKEAPKAESKETPKSESKDAPKAEAKEAPKAESKDAPKTPAEPPKDAPKQTKESKESDKK